MSAAPGLVSERLRQALPRPFELPPAPGARAAVAAVLREEPHRPAELLFILRAHHPTDPWAGHMAFPGGRVDPGDPTALAAAIRETHEELGLDLTAEAELLGRLADVPVIARGRRLPLTIEPYVFHLRSPEVALELNYEVEEALWIPLAALADPGGRRTFVWEWEGTPVTLPCFDWKGRRLWGLTLRMVDDLLARLAASRTGSC